MIEENEKSMFLSQEEVHELTGYKGSKRQIQALSMMGIVFTIRPDGVPIILREFIESELGLTPKKRKKPEPKLNFDLLYADGR